MSRRIAVAAVVSLGCFAVLVIVLTVNWQRGLDADYLCQQLVQPLPADVIGEGGRGAWAWWPTGVTCSYSTEGGGRFVTGPDPALSVVLVAAAVTAVASITLVVVTVVAASKGSKRS
jgi:hypothetical protein